LVRVHYIRPGKESRVYDETWLAEDSIRVQTLRTFPPEAADTVAAAWRHDGLLTSTQTIGSIRKHLFYAEWFTILELRDPAGHLLGHYSDIALPLTREGADYFLTDLFLDLWVPAGGPIRELDWDEFTAAEASGRLTREIAARARQVFAELRAAADAGRFPTAYI
jgi:hypothetical protein